MSQLTDQQRIKLQNAARTLVSVQPLPPNTYDPATIIYNSQMQIPQNSLGLAVRQDITGQFAAPTPHLNVLRYQQSSLHIRTLVATMILVIGLVCSLVFYTLSPGSLSNQAVIIICVVSYLLYLILAACCNQLLEYLNKISHGSNLENEYNNIRRLIGSFQLHAECYHYETRYHTRMVTDSHGHSHVQSYTTTQKVVTHTDSQTVTPTRTEDVSGQMDRVRANKSIIFIHFELGHRFSSSQSQQTLNNVYSAFKNRNRRDTHQDYSCNYVVAGLIDKQTFYVGELGCNYTGWFYVFGLLGLAWFYSMWIEQKVDRFSLPITKVLTM